MKYDDLEKTKDLFDISDIPSPIENIEMEGANKVNLSPEEPSIPDENKKNSEKKVNVKKEPQKSKKSIGEKWHDLSPKKKTIFISLICVIGILLVALVVFLCLKEDEKPVEEPPKEETPTVIVEKENYIYKNGILTFIDAREQEIGTYECQNKDENLCFIVDYNDEDKFDVPQNVYEDGTLITRKSQIYGDKYVFLYDNKNETSGVITLYNIEEQKSVGTYILVKGFADSNLVILKNSNNKYGALEISSSGIKEKMDFSFDYLGRMDKDSKIVAKKNNRYFIYNLDGKLESRGVSSEIKSYNNKYIVTSGDKYNIYDYKGEKVFKDSYDYASLLDNYIVLFKDKKLYLKDYEGNLYNAEGIEIESIDYNPKFVYNSEKVLTETKRAYEITFEKNLIHINYVRRMSDKTYTIDTNEGKLNANMEYVSYFDGKLYFYSDEDKTKLIGTYTCSNKNIIDDKTKTYTNCSVASESFYSKNETEKDNSDNLGLLPIFNEKYVFIRDNIDEANPTIVLYDLKNNKSLSRYASIDAGIYSKENKITFKITNNIYIMAENKSNRKYGLIKITNDSVSGAINFEYDSIEKLKNYYLVKESNGSYVLLDNEGKTRSGHYNDKIVDYLGGYYKVKNTNGKYGVMDINNKTVAETKYLDITLKDTYLIVINDNKTLEILKYNSDFKLKTPIQLGEDYQNDYEVTKDGEGFKITVKSTNEVISIDKEGYRPREKPETPVVTDPDTPDNPVDIPDNNDTNDDNPIE